MARGRSIVKFVIMVTSILCAGVAIERLVKIYRWSESSSPLVSDGTYNASIPLSIQDVDPILNDHYLNCILRPSKPFCLLSDDERLNMFQSNDSKESLDSEIIKNRIENATANLHHVKHSVFLLIADFMNLMESFGVKAFIIEPSVLFCFLPAFKKHSLLLTGFNPGRVQGSRNIITFGVFEKDGKVLGKMNISEAISSSRFSKISRLSVLRSNVNDSETELPVHFLFTRLGVTAHVLVFYKRNSYLWHSSYQEEDEKLLFVHSGIYENFQMRRIRGPQTDNVSIDQLFIPYDLRYFLKETDSSYFIDCTLPTQEQPSLTSELLITRVGPALIELKNILAPRLVSFWLWSRSLWGFFDHCNIFYYTSGLELALDQKSVQDLNLTALFSESNFLKIQNNKTSDPDTEFHLDGQGLYVNITILGEDSNRFWQPTADGHTQYRLQYPASPLCSADIFGHKVNIPCIPMLNESK